MYIGDIASASASGNEVKAVAVAGLTGPFGEMVPFGDPTWYQDWNSPYYNDSHRRFRTAIRAFVEKEITPFCHEWDEAKAIPRKLWEKCYEAGWLPAVAGAPWPTRIVYNFNCS